MKIYGAGNRSTRYMYTRTLWRLFSGCSFRFRFWRNTENHSRSDHHHGEGKLHLVDAPPGCMGMGGHPVLHLRLGVCGYGDGGDLTEVSHPPSSMRMRVGVRTCGGQ